MNGTELIGQRELPQADPGQEGPDRSEMVWIPGGTFRMGSDHHYAEEAPAHRVTVDGFFIDRTPVTNHQFREFVNATGYITFAEIKPDAKDYPGALPHMLKAGSLVFSPPKHPVDLADWSQWWSFKFGANWRHPYGPRSSIGGLDDHPVIHIAFRDAEAYATWAGKELPTEAEWEFAARGGVAGKPFVWGDSFRPNNKWMANTHQGAFPVKDTAEDGFAGIAPVAQYPPNGYGLYDMAGNVWQWTSDWYRPDYYQQLADAGGVAANPHGPDSAFDPEEPGQPKKVHRGGSFLCTDQYCSRYIVGTRGKGEVSTGTNHLGFRCVKNVKKAAASRAATPQQNASN